MISLAAARARTASSAIVSGAAKTLSRILQVGSARTAQSMQLTLYLSPNCYFHGQRSGDENRVLSCRVSRIATRRRRCHGSNSTQSHWQRTSMSSTSVSDGIIDLVWTDETRNMWMLSRDLQITMSYVDPGSLIASDFQMM